MKKAIFTISSSNYLHKASILLDSAKEFGDGADVFYLLVDSTDIEEKVSSAIKDYKFISLSDLKIDNFHHLAFQYDVTELNTAVKPYVFKYLFSLGYSDVLYFDPDIKIYSKLTDLFRMFSDHNAIVTPHVTEPLPFDSMFPTNWEIIWGGQFNFGFFGLKATVETNKFLDFWTYELRRACIADLGRYFYDQLPGSIITSFVENVKVIRSHSYNIAYWNFAQRQIDTSQDGSYITKDGPLVFFHFSGLNEQNPLNLTRHSTRAQILPDSPAHKIVVAYIKEAHQNKIKLIDSLFPYSFDTYKDGSKIHRDDRYKFLSLSDNDKKRIGDPFDNKESIKSIQSFPSKYLTYYELVYFANTHVGSSSPLRRRIYNLARRFYSIPVIKKNLSVRTRERLMALLGIKKNHVMIR